MEDQRLLEDFRRRSFAEGNVVQQAWGAEDARPAAQAGPSASPPLSPEHVRKMKDEVQDTTRVILHFDVDCFYAQVSRQGTDPPGQSALEHSAA